MTFSLPSPTLETALIKCLSLHYCIFFSPDGQYVICGSHDGSIFVWNASSAKLEKVLKEHT